MKEIILDEIENQISKVYAGAKIEDVAVLLKEYTSIYILYDAEVSVHTKQIIAALEKECPDSYKSKFSILAKEENKNIATVTNICEWLLEGGADRNAILLVIGGGLTTDIGGFAASIYKRGIDFAYIPTTVLAQVDAAIGGKTGVNLDSYKNIIGTIIQPKFTFLCPQPLETLPNEIFVDGLAEMFKTFIIDDAEHQYEIASDLFSTIDKSSLKMKEIFPLMIAAAKVKIGVVTRDEFEKGERRNLNLGHTFAHAIEKLSKNTISHGSAVSIGMVMAAKLSEKLGKCESDLVEKITSVLEAVGLPVKAPYSVEEMVEIMKKDKKADGDKIYFILPTSIGEVIQYKMDIDELLQHTKDRI